jgi:hypothetical protein
MDDGRSVLLGWTIEYVPSINDGLGMGRMHLDTWFRHHMPGLEWSGLAWPGLTTTDDASQTGLGRFASVSAAGHEQCLRSIRFAGAGAGGGGGLWMALNGRLLY